MRVHAQLVHSYVFLNPRWPLCYIFLYYKLAFVFVRVFNTPQNPFKHSVAVLTKRVCQV